MSCDRLYDNPYVLFSHLLINKKKRKLLHILVYNEEIDVFLDLN